jgi:outer membrane lipoprotein-sorting protein
MINFRAALVAAVALSLAAPLAAPVAVAAPVAKAALSPEDTALVEKGSAYLESLGPTEGRFIQTDPRGQVTKGAFYLQRPGKIRFEYDKPSGLLVVADGNNVNVYDQRLKTFDRYPQGATPLGIFLAKQIRLDRSVSVEKVERTADGFQMTVRDSRRRGDGSITLAFTDGPVKLKEWTVADAQGARTRVQLVSLQPAGGLAKNLFVLRDPRPRTGRP